MTCAIEPGSAPLSPEPDATPEELIGWATRLAPMLVEQLAETTADIRHLARPIPTSRRLGQRIGPSKLGLAQPEERKRLSPGSPGNGEHDASMSASRRSCRLVACLSVGEA